MTNILSGLTVIDVTQNVAGPVLFTNVRRFRSHGHQD